MRDLESELTLARQRLNELAEALRFYADPVTYEDNRMGEIVQTGADIGPFRILPMHFEPAAILSDRGYRARQALKVDPDVHEHQAIPEQAQGD